jgi:hypothetical protein
VLKTIFVAAMSVLNAGTSASAQSINLFTPHDPGGSLVSSGLDGIVWRVRLLDRVDYRVGFGLTLGQFGQLSQQCRRIATPADLKQLLTDVSPVVRVLGLVCLAKAVDAGQLAALAAPLNGDTATVEYTNGCVLDQRVTVASIFRHLVDGTFFR